VKREAKYERHFTKYKMRILITAGGTREYIDPVRFISNASSGRMGYALARAALKAGHQVTLITAPTSQKPPSTAKLVNVETAAQMFEAVKKHFSRCDCLIMAAAVADYTPVRPAGTKIKKSDKSMIIKLKPTTDILKWAGKQKQLNCQKAKVKRKIVVGFALEDKAIRVRAEKKLKDKNLDMIVANTCAAIGAEKSTVQIKMPGGEWLKLPKASKAVIAGKIIFISESLVST
jgi:phosphopantothenoylcysteine synthetase/decarboxylase